MLAGKFGDPVLGLDAHMVIPPPPVPPPGPPAPLPHPFVGVVFDPLGALLGGTVKVNGLPCANTGTAVTGIAHKFLFIPPGVGPHPCDEPRGSEGTIITGSKTVTFGGSSESRGLSVVASCSFPIDLPTSAKGTLPIGNPVIVGGPEAVDYEAAAMTLLNSRWLGNKISKAKSAVGKFLSKKLHSLFGAEEGSFLSKAICFLTGHPVDVMTGELIAEAVDFDVPGLLPMKWERNYRSRQSRDGALGPGWSHPFDERVVETEQGITLWLGDGRPKRHRSLGRGERDSDAHDRYEIERTELGYETKSWDGIRRIYRKLEGARDYLLTEVRDRARNTIKLTYDRSYLVRIDDTGGRAFLVRWTRSGRIEGIYFEEQPLVRYEYDAENRLAAAIDPLGHAIRYRYAGGVMVEEVHKSGLTFHFEWDWENPEGWCVRTWGENPRAAAQPGEAEGVPKYIYDRRITYDAEKHFTSVDDGRGGVTHYWGNDLGVVEKEMDPSGVVREYAWDAAARKTSETDGEGNTTEWEYDERGNCVLERDALGNETRRTFDAENQLVRVVDPAGGVWEIGWGHHGKPESVRNPLGIATRYTRDEHGRLLGIDDPMGRSVRATWTARHDLESVTDGERHTTQFQHDGLGRVTASRDAGGRVARAARDAMGRITYLERADGERLRMSYDAEGNVTEQVDSLGRTVKMAYAGMNRLVEHVDPMGHRVRLVYDGEEDLVAVENQIGERYRFELDLAGRVRDEIGFDGKKSRYLYDKAGRTNRVLAPDYAITTIARDALGRVAKRSLKAPPGPHADPMRVAPRLEEETFEYNARGELTGATANEVAVRFERDAVGRIVAEQRTSEGVTRQIDSHFDDSGFRIERETSFGHRTRYGWNNAGDLTGINAGVSDRVATPELRALRLPAFELPDWEVKISRDPLGLELARRMPGGVVAIWKRDTFGRPAQREVLTGAFPGRQATDVARVGYEWQSPDQIAALIDSKRGATRYEYDPRGHLIAELFPDGTVQHRASDAVSNVFRTRDRSDRKYGRGGRLERVGSTEYRYDGQGNLIEKVLADGARWKYLWTVSGRLSEVVRPDGGRVAFEYDALGRRVRKEFEGRVTEFVWDGDDLVHERVTEKATGKLDPLVTWIFEPGTFAPVAKFEGRKRYSVATDHLGTPSMLMTEAGKLAWKAQLDVYGVPREERGEVAAGEGTKNPWRFPGQYEDEETGLYYNRFRYFDRETGIYLSSDPVTLSGGLPQYGYVRDCKRWIDPLGLNACSPVPESYINEEHAVDMSKAPIGPKTTFTSRGFQRDKDYFWQQLMERKPEMFSPGNRWKVNNGYAPRVDPTWVQHNPTHVGYGGDTLVHHHIDHGPTAVPLPQTVHQQWSGVLH